jgi:hypothetical protein
MTAKSAAILFGVVFIAVGLLGFIDNPIIGTSANAIFHADTVHNAVHIGSGVLFILFALASPGAASGFMILFGIVYLAIGILGMVSIGGEGMTKLLGVLHVNGADNYLHIALGAVILIAGFATRSRAVARA